MTKSEFKKKLEEAKEIALNTSREIRNNRESNSKKYAEQYLELIISLVKKYNFERYEVNLYSFEWPEEIIGNPYEKDVSITHDMNEMMTVKLFYRYNQDNYQVEGLPKFMQIDMKIIDTISDKLEEYDIHLIHGRGYCASVYEIEIEFNAEILEVKDPFNEKIKSFE